MRTEQVRSSNRMYAVVIVVVVAVALLGAGRPAEAQEAPQAGCYRADRPLGASGGWQSPKVEVRVSREPCASPA